LGRNPQRGIPQGSLLEPILFLNDLPNDVTCTSKIFADDNKLFQGIRSHENCLQLQDDLNRLVDWSQKRQMRPNVLHLGPTNPRYEYSMRNTSLEAITEEKGVTIDRDMKFHKHVSKAVKKRQECLDLLE